LPPESEKSDVCKEAGRLFSFANSKLERGMPDGEDWHEKIILEEFWSAWIKNKYLNGKLSDSFTLSYVYQMCVVLHMRTI
jgi:hypothetical protein